MKKITAFLIIFLSFVFISINLLAQTYKSEWSEIYINKKEEIVDTLPPTINMISPHVRPGNHFVTEYDEFTLVGSVYDDFGISELLINSKNVLPNSSGLFKENYQLDEGINTFKITVIDLNGNFVESEVVINYTQTNFYTEELNVKGEYYALIIAVEDYADPNVFNLQNPINDAHALKKVLASKYLFKAENISLIENPTRDEIINSFDHLSRKLTNEDNLLVFYAGHGWWDEEANIGYWLPSDASKTSKARWVRNSTVQDYLKEIKAKHTFLVTDACFSGSIFTARSFDTETSKAIKKMYELPSRKAMTSGTLTEVPDESIFVKYFIDRLKNNEDPFISAEQLFSSFRIAVINNSEALPQYGVIKNVGDEGGDFIFILKNP